jgi:hypothetical protein
MKKYLALLMLPTYMSAGFCSLDGKYVFADALYLKASTCDNNYVINDCSYIKRLNSVRNQRGRSPYLLPVGCEMGSSPCYSWGYRVGVGSLFNCDRNDMRIDYTHLKTHVNECTIGSPKTALWPTFGFPQGPLTSLRGKEAVATNEFTTRYDAGNIEVASLRKKECSFNMRTSFGLHLARFKVTKDVTYFEELSGGFGPVFEAIPQELKAEIGTSKLLDSKAFSSQNKTWGVGPRVGGEINYPLYWGFGVEGKAGFAVLAGKNKTEFQSNLSLISVINQLIPPSKIPVTVRETVYTGYQDVKNPCSCLVFPELDAALGLTYDTGCLCRCITAKFSVGYEFRTYLNVIKSYGYLSSNSGRVLSFAGFSSGSGNSVVVCDHYSLQGLYIRGSFSF